VLGVTRLVCLDGAYELYPDGKPRSSSDLIQSIRYNADQADMALLLYQPHEVWAGNEVQKRQVMLDLAHAISDEGDWLVVWDSDYKLIDAPPAKRISGQLSNTTDDFGVISFTESKNQEPHIDNWPPMRMFMRVQPEGIRMNGNHHTYRLADGRQSQILARPEFTTAPAEDLSDIYVRHCVADRDLKRRAKQTIYYEQRDSLGVES
jgi:hypothetical protein